MNIARTLLYCGLETIGLQGGIKYMNDVWMVTECSLKAFYGIRRQSSNAIKSLHKGHWIYTFKACKCCFKFNFRECCIL